MLTIDIAIPSSSFFFLTTQYKQDMHLRYPEYSPEEDKEKMIELLGKYRKENQDPHESFIYPLPRNAYNSRLKKEQELRELQAQRSSTESSAPATTESTDGEIKYADQQDWKVSVSSPGISWNRDFI